MCVFLSPGSDAGGRPATSTLNRFSALQQPSSSSGSSLDSDRRVPQRWGTGHNSQSQLSKFRRNVSQKMHCGSVQNFVFVFFSFFLWHSAFPLSYRNSSSRERGDNFDRSNRSSDRFDRRDDRDRNRLQVTKRSFSRENEERSREREQRGSADPVRRVASMTDDRDRGSRDRARSRENGGWHDSGGIDLGYILNFNQ